MKDHLYLGLLPDIENWLAEDDLNRNIFYSKNLPQLPVRMSLKIKSDLKLAGTDYFIATFMALGIESEQFNFLNEFEGKNFKSGDVIELPFNVPFAIALNAERLALNLLQHASSIATWTHQHVALAQELGIKILDTRKTTPGLRSLEKYAVRVGGGFNHRFGQTDAWMIKDNHKTCMGGLKGALNFFKSQGAFYNNIIAEIHDLSELKEALELGINHVMLDNFSREEIEAALKLKPKGMTFEVSGGIRLNNIKDYLIEGVDAISIGAITYSAPRVDLSLKYKPV